MQVACWKEMDTVYLWLIKVFWRNHETWLPVFVAYEAIDCHKFTPVTADNLPAKRSTCSGANNLYVATSPVVAPMSTDAVSF